MKRSYTIEIALRFPRFFSIVLIFLLLGCSTTQPRYQATPWEAIRTEMGTVGVVAAEFEPEREFVGYARGKGSGAARGAGRAFASWLLEGDDFFPLNVLLLPFAAAGGAVRGAVTAEPKKDIEAGEAEIYESLELIHFQNTLQDRVPALIRERTSHPVVSLSEGGPTFLEETPHYQALADKNIDTVLEVAVLKIGSGGSGINAPIRLFIDARTRLFRGTDGLLLFEKNHIHNSEARKFLEWSADEAASLRQAFAEGIDELAGQIVDEVFLSYSLEDGMTGNQGLKLSEPVAVEGFFSKGKKVSSLQPVFMWEEFPRPYDRERVGEREISNVTYELKVFRVDKRGANRLVVEENGIAGTAFTPEVPMAPKESYRWTVRARFDLDGQPRVTGWSVPGQFKTPRGPQKAPEEE